MEREILDQEQARGDCWKLLAACFYAPQKDLFAGERVLSNLTRLLQRVCPEAAGFSAEMEDAFSKTPHDELLIEFARLFVGPYELKAPPYGSVYLESGRTLMGNSTVEVWDFYRGAGLELDDRFKDLPDHITAELEFLYYLVYREVEAWKKNETDRARHFIERQTDFTNRFVAPWLPSFCAKIKEHTRNEFYAALADCLSTFVSNCRPPDF